MGNSAQTFGLNATPLPESAGGTGESTFTNGQLLIGNTSSGGLNKATLTAGSNISISNGNGSITISATGSGVSTALTKESLLEDFTAAVVLSSATACYPGNTIFRTISGLNALVTAEKGGTTLNPFLDNSIGIFSLTPGTTNTGYASITCPLGNVYNLDSITSKFTSIMSEWRFRLEDLSDGTERYMLRMGWARASGQTGFTAAGTAAAAVGVYVEYIDNINSGQFVLQIRNSGTTSTSLTHTALAADTWYTLRIQITFGTDIKVWLNGNLLMTETTLTNIPTGSTNFLNPSFQIVKTVGTTSRLVYLDYLLIENTMTNSRS